MSSLDHGGAQQYVNLGAAGRFLWIEFVLVSGLPHRLSTLYPQTRLAQTLLNCLLSADMAPKAKTAPRSKPRAKKHAKPARPLTAPQQQRKLAADNEGAPLLKVFEPAEDQYPAPTDWAAKLEWLIETTPITRDMISDRIGCSRATVYSWSSSDADQGVPQSTLLALAQQLGFTPDMWYRPMAQFVSEVRGMYSGYSYASDGQDNRFTNNHNGINSFDMTRDPDFVTVEPMGDDAMPVAA